MGKSIDIELLKESAKVAALTPFYYLKNLFTNLDFFKEKKLDYLNDVKDYYQEKIEEKTGIKLGEIEIGFFSDKVRDIYWDLMIEKVEKIDQTNSTIEKKVKEMNNFLRMATTVYPIGKVVASTLRFSAGAMADIKNSKIIFNDGYFNRVIDDVFKKSEDSTMIHELGHFLWNHLKNGYPKEELNKEEKITQLEWEEGFTTFGQRHYFKEFLLPDSIEMKVFGKYSTGLKKVKQTIEKHGQDVYLEIPNKWKEFEQEINQT